MSTPTVENRKSFRRRTLLGGAAIFNQSFSSFTCRVRNLSETGARLSFDDVPHLPAHFDLRLDQRDVWTAPRQVKRIWSKEKEMGVIFE